MTGPWWARVAVLVALRPWLWPTAIRQAAALAVPGWWRRWPPLPAPDAAYLRFRLQTAYGDPARDPVPHDVLTWLRWCRGWRAAARAPG